MSVKNNSSKIGFFNTQNSNNSNLSLLSSNSGSEEINFLGSPKPTGKLPRLAVYNPKDQKIWSPPIFEKDEHEILEVDEKDEVHSEVNESSLPRLREQIGENARIISSSYRITTRQTSQESKSLSDHRSHSPREDWPKITNFAGSSRNIVRDSANTRSINNILKITGSTINLPKTFHNTPKSNSRTLYGLGSLSSLDDQKRKSQAIIRKIV